MKKITKYISCVLLFLCALPAVAQQKIKADLIVANATIYTMDATMSTQRYMVIVNGKVAVVSNSPDNIFDRFESDHVLNLEGKYIYPGFNDAHCHFYGLGLNLLQANLKGVTSYDELLARLQTYVQQNKNKKMKSIVLFIIELRKTFPLYLEKILILILNRTLW